MQIAKIARAAGSGVEAEGADMGGADMKGGIRTAAATGTGAAASTGGARFGKVYFSSPASR